jgi:hypothetical protein
VPTTTRPPDNAPSPAIEQAETKPALPRRYLGVLSYAVELSVADLFKLVTAHRHGNSEGVQRQRERIAGLAEILIEHHPRELFVEMLVGAAAVEVLRQEPGTEFGFAEFSVRATLRRFIPELRTGPMMLLDVGDVQ